MFTADIQKPSIPTLALLLVVGFVTSKIFYNIFLHPLRSFPGPFLGRATLIEYQRQLLKGYNHLWIQSLHKKYGPVVRISPNVLSFIEPEVWKDVYGHKATSFTKDVQYFYGPDAYGNPPGLIRADNVNHARQRKLVSHAFSDKALKEQEHLLKGYVNTMVDQLKKISTVKDGDKIDLVKWYNFTTFDIMADLAFGESLGQLSSAKYSAWVETTFAFIKYTSIARIGREWGLTKLLSLLISNDTKAKRYSYMRFSSEKVDERMARETDRPDIWTYVTKNSHIEGSELAPTELHSNGTLFMLAGTETTATELSGLTYMLLKNPQKLARLTKEIRSAFTSFDDITMVKLSQLEYLQACIEEGLRMYPPVPAGLPRTTPQSGAKVCNRWIPGGTIVQCSIFSASRSPANFKDSEAFVPERFLPEGAKEYSADRKDALNPFSFGPRNCVGKNLAYHEMRLMLASVLLHFDLELGAESSDWMNQQCFNLWEKSPLMVKLKPAY